MKRIPILLVSLILGACGGGSPTPNTAVLNTAPPVAVIITALPQVAVIQPVAIADPCAVPKHQYGDIPIPTGYVGAFPIPVSTQKLSANIIRGINLKDYYPGYLGLPIGCNDRTLFAHNTYIETLDRIKTNGAESTTIYNYGPWDDITQPIFKISDQNYQIPESEVIFIIAEAKKRNLKVKWLWQFYFNDVKGNQAPDVGSPEFPAFFKAAMDTWHVHVIKEAKLAQQYGIDGFYVDFQYFIPDFPQRSYWQYYIDKMYTIVSDVKGVYSGKIKYGLFDSRAIDSRFIGKVDAIQVNLGFYETSQDYVTKLNVQLLKDRYAAQISQLYTDTTLGKLGIPIEWLYSSASIDGAFVAGFVEDGFCVDKCMQLSLKTDFSVQAIGYEAALEAISEQTYFKTDTFNVSAYWLTDDITPTHWGKSNSDPTSEEYDFPNESPSIRNKPAEGIVRQWFSR